MIGSHNTLTYLKPTCFIFSWFKRYWRSQEIDLDTQYKKYNVRFFDIRVFKNKHLHWQACHGIVNLDFQKDTLKDLCDYIEHHYPEALYRIIIEKGYTTSQLDRAHAKLLGERYKNLVSVSYKSGISEIVVIAHNNNLNENFKKPLWKSPHIELNGGYHYRDSYGVFKNLFRFLKHSIKKNFLKMIESKQFLTKNNIETKDYVILSDYINLLR